jgi:hypothetical protein
MELNSENNSVRASTTVVVHPIEPVRRPLAPAATVPRVTASKAAGASAAAVLIKVQDMVLAQARGLVVDVLRERRFDG